MLQIVHQSVLQLELRMSAWNQPAVLWCSFLTTNAVGFPTHMRFLRPRACRPTYRHWPPSLSAYPPTGRPTMPQLTGRIVPPVSCHSLVELLMLFHVFGAIDKTSFLVFQRTVKYAISSSSSSSSSLILRLLHCEPKRNTPKCFVISSTKPRRFR